MNIKNIEDLIKAEIPGADVQIEDIRGDGSHLSAVVISGEFEGLTRIQQHRKVQNALEELIDNDDIHALQLTTKTS